MIKLRKVCFFLIFSLFLFNCSENEYKNRYRASDYDLKNKRSPSENEFIKSGGYKIKIPQNPFVSSKEAIEIYNKDSNSLRDIPKPPSELDSK